jgi:hypothetical protein
VAELADAMDLKSIGSNTLRVQVPPAPLFIKDHLRRVEKEKSKTII